MRARITRLAAPVAGAVTVGLFLAGAWQRRWIADDGLIVLRTVRNLLAGNGPVFNVGERVETNTSAAWTYLVYAAGWVSQARLEYLVLALALVLSAAAVALALLGGRLLYRHRVAAPMPGETAVLLPAGVLIYIALPPARDYASSGLETALVIFWLSLVWVLLLWWANQARPTRKSVVVTAFVAGLGPLVRPELAVVSILALVVLVCADLPGRFLRVSAILAAAAVPVGYQIWRMGYYGLPYPNTAVAKDAAGSKWAQGGVYLWDIVGSYALWLSIPVVLSGGIAAYLGDGRRSRAESSRSGGTVRLCRRRLRSPAAVIAVVLCGGVVLAVYALRVGGDFMHGRMLLPVVFCWVLPVAVLPIRNPLRRNGRAMGWAAWAVYVAWMITVVWAVVVVRVGSGDGEIAKSGIVDERAYYVLNTGHANPIRAEDYLDFPRMRSMLAAIGDSPAGGLLIPTPSFIQWFVVPPPLPIPDGGAGHTVYFLNLGMTSMNLPLDVRVLDPVGLAYPLAAHSDQLTDGRIGHDKNLYAEWVVTDAGMVDRYPWLPTTLDERWVSDAGVALTCPATQDLLASYRAELTWPRFKQNLKRAIGFAGYRFDRVPRYEIARCGLTRPDTVPR